MGKKENKKDNRPEKSGKGGDAGTGSGWPTWATVLIVLVCVGFLGVGAVLVWGGAWCGNVLLKAEDPAYVESVVGKLCTLDKMPPEFKPLMAIDAFGLKFFTVGFRPPGKNVDSLHITVGLAPPAPPDKLPESAEQLTKALEQQGLPEVQFSRSFDTKTRDKILVGGEPFAYVTGDATTKEGGKIPAMIGTVLSKDRKKALMIYGFGGEPGTAYDMENTKRFLAAIKSVSF